MKRIAGHQYLYRRGEHLIFRRAVPAFARAAFKGRSEVHASLGTSSVAEARHLLPLKLREFEAILFGAKGLSSPRQIALQRLAEPTPDEIERGVREWFTERMSRSDPDYADASRLEVELERINEDVAGSLKAGSTTPNLATKWVADALIDRFGWSVEEGSAPWRRLIRGICRGQLEAVEWQRQDLRGEPRKIGDDTFAPQQYVLDDGKRAVRRNPPVSLVGLFDEYAVESGPKPSTIKGWRRQLRAFVSHLGHDDAREVTTKDIIAWKEALLSGSSPSGSPLTAKTVRDTYLSVIKTTFRWGVENGRVESDPAAIVKVRGPRGTVVEARERGLSDKEAQTILRATVGPQPPGLTRERADARRWVPWLCAYTGARVNEMSQLRSVDIQRLDGVWTLTINPDAGTVKSGRSRTVALHPHLIEQGFVAFAQTRSGPLFYDPSRRRGGSIENPQASKVGEHLAEWVRGLGVNDRRVQPNHGWRHRFKTQARLCEMREEVRDYIMGHVPRSVGEGYGDYPPKVTLREIKLLKRYDDPTA